ncbi:putative cyclin-D7-1 [Cornus florida]|uniref:putative cyclin-D7-1 n=1 Tax=Cornus florida TaxID=4283 RepID=UPI0028A2D765|nr:putative cyclin-D7-1 [Cornus florida]
MESLYCDEVGLMSPYTTTTVDQQHNAHNKQPLGVLDQSSFYTSKEDCEQALSICLQKECTYLPQPGYSDYLKTYNLIIPRFIAIQWLIKSQKRLNLSFGTIFNAANYLDRFISMNLCHGWKYWMYELLSVACLSVASKFDDTASHPFHELQEDLDHSFESSMIQRMELSVLKALGWRLSSTTAYSYIQLLICNIDSLKPSLLEDLTTRVTELLLGTLLDFKFLEFRPCVVAISALQCIFDELLPSTSDAHIACVVKLIPQEQKDDLMKCHRYMEKQLVDPNLYNLIACRYSYYCPSSPVTVLSTDRVEIYDCQIDLSRINVKASVKKRKREEQ